MLWFLWRGGGCKERMRAVQSVYRFPISKQFMGHFFDRVAFPGPTLSKNEQGMSFFCFVQNQLLRCWQRHDLNLQSVWLYLATNQIASFYFDSTAGNGCISTSVLKMESDNNRQLINSLKQLNPMSAAENVLSMRKILHRAN